MQAFYHAIRPVRNHDGHWQVAVLGGAWQTILLGDGITPAAMPDSGWAPSACIDFWGEGYLLLLAHLGGHRVTWVLDERLRTRCDLEDPALEDMPDMRQVLSGPATVLRLALRARLVFRSDEALGAALRGMNARGLARFLGMAESRRARFLSLDAFKGTLSLPSAGGDTVISPDRLARVLDGPAGSLAPAMEAGRVQVLAIASDGPADAVLMVGRQGTAPIFLCVERKPGLSYYLVCRDGASPVLYFPNDNLFVSRDMLDAATMRSLLDVLDASIAGVAAALAALDVSSLPDRTEGLGLLSHGTPSGATQAAGQALAQEVDALAAALGALPPGHQPPTLYLAAPGASALDRFGTVEGLFPEFAGRVVRAADAAAALAHGVASGTEVVPLGGRPSSPDARARITGFLDRAADGGQADQARATCQRDGKPRLVVTFGIPLRNRRLAELLGFYGRLAGALAGRFASVVFLLDGGEAAPDLASAAGGGVGPVERNAWVAALRDRLAPLEAEVVDCTGLPAVDRLQWLRRSSFFVAPLSGSGLPELRWILDVPGLVLLEEDEAAAERNDPLRPYTDEALLGGPVSPLYSSRMERAQPAPDPQGAGAGGRKRPRPAVPVLHEDGLVQRTGDLIAAQLAGSGLALREVERADPGRRKARRGLRRLLFRRSRGASAGAPVPAAGKTKAKPHALPPSPPLLPLGPGLRCIDIVKDYPVHHGRRRVLDHVNLELARGQKLGILGRNGAGKSTLIRIIGGVDLPTAGQVVRDMSVSWPLGFTGAFQGSLSGIDNLRFICRIYGLDYDDTRLFVDDFAELGRQLGEPVKNYSSGMRARLAFALSIAIEFDCYLIDEVIMVGDKRFTDRCKRELFEKRADRSLILVSHDMGIISEVCSTAAVIHERQLHMCDSVLDAVSFYESM